MQKEKNAMERLNDLIKEKNSRICAGFDPNWKDIPAPIKQKCHRSESEEQYQKQTIYQYGAEYIEAVYDIVPAIKMNSAFFERHHLEDVYRALASEAKQRGLFVIGDVKRADIGSTSEAYADAYLKKNSHFDAITINPYFGTDGVMPFFKQAKENGKGVFVLVKTSNKSAGEIQDLKLEDGRYVYDAVSDLVIKWAKSIEEKEKDYSWEEYPIIGAVVGATHVQQAKEIILDRLGDFFVLVPGYGAQGATAKDVALSFDPNGLGAIINSSRGIMNAYQKDCWKKRYSEETWAEAAREEAIRATEEINQAINEYFGKKVC